jgi:glucose/arabinose dehydrogenase
MRQHRLRVNPSPGEEGLKSHFPGAFWHDALARGIVRGLEGAVVKRLGLTAVLLMLSLGACRYLLPERFAVNVPIESLIGGAEAPAEDVIRARIRVPEGFQIGVFAQEIGGARGLRFTPSGDLLVSVPSRGRIELLEADADGDGRSDGQRLVIDELERPYGMDLHDGWLYVGETDAVGRIRFDSTAGATRGDYERLVTGIPTGGHWTRTVRFGADGWLYVSIGSSCNVCNEEDPRRAAIVRYRADGSGEEIYATGLRNAVGFDWHPQTGELYANDNGRDLLGDDFPPCELNRIEAGGFYGWPVANGDRIPDPDFGEGQAERIRASSAPVHGYPAHNAPLGLAFIRGERVPADYRGAALSALHGSWNRSEKDGYKVVSLHWRPDGSIEQRDFISGFEVDDDVIGRPVDVAEGPDGAFYISDDYAGLIYRVVGMATAPAAPVGP